MHTFLWIVNCEKVTAAYCTSRIKITAKERFIIIAYDIDKRNNISQKLKKIHLTKTKLFIEQ